MRATISTPTDSDAASGVSSVNADHQATANVSTRLPPKCRASAPAPICSAM